MTYKEVLQAAQGQMGPCRACPVCNGRACGGTIPAPVPRAAARWPSATLTLGAMYG